MLISLFATPARAQNETRDPYGNLPVPHTYNCYGNVLGKNSVATPTANKVPTPPCTHCGPVSLPPSSVNGAAVTPRGNLRILVISAGFTEDINTGCSDYGDGGWPQRDGVNPIGTTLPGNLPDFGYTNQSQFSLTATDKTVSNLFYQMSQTCAAPFRVTFDHFPQRMNVSRNAAGAGDIAGYSQAVLNQIEQDYPNYNWSPWDQRTNAPGYQFSSLGTAPDGKLDYVVINWRAGECSKNFLPKNTGMAGVPSHTFPATGGRRAYTISTGHMQTGMSLNAATFLHEFAHTLYNAPHTWGVNSGTTGPYWNQTFGWGLMTNVPTFYSSNAWERWYVGWTELRTGNSQVSSDIQDAASLTATSGIYTLRDFVTTGDVVRIQLPNTNQYLWLENRAKDGVFDRSPWDIGGDGVAFRAAPKGLVGMVEDMNPGRENQSRFYSLPPNGLRTVSAQGNFDYTRSTTYNTLNNHLWGGGAYNLYGPTGSISAPVPNPTGNSSQIATMRYDVDGDGKIDYSSNDGNGGTTGNETAWNWLERGQIQDGALGPDIGSRQVGFRYGLDTNPLIIPHQTYDETNEKLSQIPLNGLSVEIIDYNAANGDLSIKVRYDDTGIKKSTRWTGDLKTYAVANATNGAEVYVNSGVTLTLDRSGTAQRAHPGPSSDFVNDTRLTVSSGTQLITASAGNLCLEGKGTTLYLEENAVAIIGTGGYLFAGPGTTISVQYRSDLQDQKQLILKIGSQLIIRSTGQVIPGTQRPFPALAPNPTETGTVAFAWPQGTQPINATGFHYDLRDLQGHSLRQGSCQAGPTELPGVAAGIYLLVTTSPDGERQTRRVEVR